MARCHLLSSSTSVGAFRSVLGCSGSFQLCRAQFFIEMTGLSFPDQRKGKRQQSQHSPDLPAGRMPLLPFSKLSAGFSEAPKCVGSVWPSVQLSDSEAQIWKSLSSAGFRLATSCLPICDEGSRLDFCSPAGNRNHRAGEGKGHGAPGSNYSAPWPVPRGEGANPARSLVGRY
jgi:hypothetical protein